MPVALKWIVGLGLAALWMAGLRVFVTASLTPRRKWSWTLVLLAVGFAAGIILPLDDLWRKLLWLLALIPLFAAADVFWFRSRGIGYWIRACGFELGTVFGIAALARAALDFAGFAPLVIRLRS